MDEAPIKAGRHLQGKLRQAYFWPVYGDSDEIVFHYGPSRAHLMYRIYWANTSPGPC